ncbi:substrate-binding periplasmic protein [Inhella proteolytica]|uniref:Amino acid ABC transporter substrate-binding protein n=1 Tax=Inhella proteolytica TaxID=2795029 RepID=A0A931J411_9BURK|nr:transporter substrate-binding domain-containing protein [Inhella proteolytica]MBH9579201.1 amino acid ABC transporter substrate-binding protein [Inhella proteolytica]
MHRRLVLSTPLALLAPPGGAAAPAGTATALAARPLQLVNTVYPPFVNPPGHPDGEGIDVEIARAVLARLGLGCELELVPWKRALLMLEWGRADFTTTISRRDDRDRYLLWSAPYRSGANYRFYCLPGGPAVNSLADLRGLRLGVVAGFHYPPPIAQEGGARLVPGRDIAALAAMLRAGRTDCMVVTAIAGAWEVRQLGLEQQLLRQAFEHHSDSPNYLAFSRARTEPTFMPRVDAALKTLMLDGTLARIERKVRV